MELEVVWNGAHRGQNLDLLCVDPTPLAPAPVTTKPPRRYESQEPLRRTILSLLADGRVWRVRDLPKATGREPENVNMALYSLKRLGLAKRVSFGRVQIVREA